MVVDRKTYRDPPIRKKLKGKRTKGKASTKYGDTNPREWFAENYALYEMGKKDLVDPSFIKFFEENIL